MLEAQGRKGDVEEFLMRLIERATSLDFKWRSVLKGRGFSRATRARARMRL
jgi:hypothetical protein